MKEVYYILGGLLVVTIATFLLMGCDKKEEASVDKIELIFTQKEESKEFNISCTGEWHIEADGMEPYLGPNMADVKDFTFAPISGKGNAKVSVTLNNEIIESYDIELKIVGESNQVVVKLKAVAN